MVFFGQGYALIKIGIIFALMIMAIRRRWSLGSTFLVSSAALGILFGQGLPSMLRSALNALADPKIVSLGIVICLILILSTAMEVTGHMKRLLDSFKGLAAGPRVSMILFPALIGLLPMPGGAIFSAPMVKEMGQRGHLGADKLSYINYWFRHIWEYWWPLYPGILLVSALAGIRLERFMIFMCPLTIVTILAGYLPLLGENLGDQAPPVHAARAGLYPFFLELAPIIITIVAGIALGAALAAVVPHLRINKELGFMGALCLALGWVYVKEDMTPRSFMEIACSRGVARMLYMVLSIFIFKGIFEGSHAVQSVAQELMQYSLPLSLLAVLLPFLVGSVTGMTVAFVGSTFPILLTIMASLGQEPLMFPYLMLALISGLLGVILSPVHLCLLLSNQYFGTGLGAVYRHLWLPSLCILIFGILYFWIAKTVIFRVIC
jgi:hypothetical protein